MKTENVLYTDGHDVTVTDSVLQVREKWYTLDGITKHGLAILQPVRLPGILLLAAGATLALAGGGSLINLQIAGADGIPLDVNRIALGVGIFLLILGTVVIWSMSERYAVTITTAEGEKNVVISKRKEYITQIVHALNDAFFARVSTGATKSVDRKYTVSGR